MPLDCEVVVDPDVSVVAPERFARLLRDIAPSESPLAESQWQMSLRLSSDETIATLHERFFNDPSATDVITFPSGEPAAPEGAHLGDVVVSVETAAQQAIDAGHSTSREIAFLALHGLLHLCGYDDATSADREAMLNRQSELLDEWESRQGHRL